MRASDLDLRELLSFSPDGGIITFGGQRAVIFDTVALGLLRRTLIDTLGMTAARGVLTRFGYAHGWRVAETMKEAFPWDSEREWRIAGGRLHRLRGFVNFEPVTTGEAEFAEAIWKDSYEAEQHLLFQAQADEPVCWTSCGFASGYLSYCNGKAIYCIETRCRGKGDAACHMVGRAREEWGDEIAPQIAFYEKECVDGALARITEALKTTERQLRSRRQELARGAGEGVDPSGIVARSDGMKRALDLARRVSRVDSTVLVTGESGVGKEGLARLIHTESARAGRPFVAINCGALPETLLESELFGHARGAFTGAVQERAGLFEAANGGTLLLDEIGDVPAAVQVKLLRTLQEREVRRVGENKSRAVDVRIIAATNRDLAADVVSGRFRQDLYYRLRVIEVRVPALRERREDILPLARILLADASRRLGRKIEGIAPEACQKLARHDWPGNVRELQNALERAVVVAAGARIEEEDLPDEVRSALPGPLTPGKVRSLEEVEREYILAVLHATGGNRARAAADLKIGTATLFRKLKQYAIAT